LNSNNTYPKPKVGVLGAGSFGTAIANLVAENESVYLYVRDKQKLQSIISTQTNRNQKLSENIVPSNQLQEVIENCPLLFPIVPSSNFRDFIKEIAPYINPQHTLIHGTKGFDVSKAKVNEKEEHLLLEKKQINTMSEVILEETIALKIGVISGPNLALEISEGQPAASVISSKFDEVFRAGSQALRSTRFQVLKSYDVTGTEVAGALKNIMAIGAGILHGMGFGLNARAMLISRGLNEIIRIGQIFGAQSDTFLGIAGIGDLIATCSSTLSRNFSLGNALAQGKRLNEILDESQEVIEGVKTVMITKALANRYNLKIPITNKIFEVLFKDLPVEKGIRHLMVYRNLPDIDFVV